MNLRSMEPPAFALRPLTLRLECSRGSCGIQRMQNLGWFSPLNPLLPLFLCVEELSEVFRLIANY
jgi:hypothetical protein